MKLQTNSALRSIHQDVLRQAVQLAAARARAQAPGSLASAVRWRMFSTRGTTVGEVYVEDRERDGFRYPHALNTAKRIKFRYRSGPRKGRLTRNWFTSAKTGVKSMARVKLKSAATSRLRAWWV